MPILGVGACIAFMGCIETTGGTVKRIVVPFHGVLGVAVLRVVTSTATAAITVATTTVRVVVCALLELV